MGKFDVVRESGSLAAAGGEALNNLLANNMKQPVLLLLSAGSALGLLDYINAKNTGEHLTVAMLDERFSRDPAVNNFAQLQKTDFYAMAFDSGASFFGSLPRAGETAADLAKRMEKNLREWRAENPDGIIIATLGLGGDGHTAGIFPFPEAPDEFHRLFESQPWMVAYNADGKHKFSERVTASLTFFKFIDFGLAYVCGETKKEKLDRLLSNNQKPADLPALGWHKIKNIKIFTDLE